MFDVNGPPKNLDNLFSLDCSAEESKVHILPVPFDATSSYRRVSVNAPEAIIEASQQIDLYDPLLGEPWKHGIWMYPLNQSYIAGTSSAASLLVDLSREVQRGEIVKHFDYNTSVQRVNAIGKDIYNLTHDWTQGRLNSNVITGILGGDHSISLGGIKAASEKYDDLVVIQIDAHADLRKDYEGFVYSHASVMYNVLYDGTINYLIQFGVRDLCSEERLRQHNFNDTIYTFFDQLTDWDNLDLIPMENRIVTSLQERVANILHDKPVWITCDIDGLDPSLCPNTGTPVPGGLTWKQFCKLLNSISSISNIVGFDLVEVGKEDLDANIGARALYQLIGNAVRNK